MTKKRITGNALHLLKYLEKEFSEKGEFFISNEQIANQLNCSKTTASLIIKRLIAAGKLVLKNESPRILGWGAKNNLHL